LEYYRFDIKFVTCVTMKSKRLFLIITRELCVFVFIFVGNNRAISVISQLINIFFFKVSSNQFIALPVLLYGSETWAVKARDSRRITAAEMKYMRITAGYTRTDCKTNKQIANELKITPILDKLLEYKRNWIQRVNRMPRNKLPRVMKHYSSTGRRNRGRPLKRLPDM